MKKQLLAKECLLKEIENFIKNAPEGGLKFQRKNGKIYYYQQKKNLETKQWEKTYIKKKQIKLAKELAQKGYLISVRTVLKSQLAWLREFIKEYKEEDIEEIYRQLPEERKVLVEPVSVGIKEKLEAWTSERYEINTAFSEYLIYETDHGELVRSKSELIIANVLYQYKDDIDYKYERPLKLKTKEGNIIVVHPDFTIINKHTGKIYYYEHAGRMDEPKYSVDFVKKINLYSNNNIIQGDELLVTYETYNMPLDINCVKKIVNSILREVI